MITTPPFTTPSLKYGPWLLSGDIDGDGNPDIFGESVGVFYGSGARNTFLAKVTDGLGNVVTVSYHAPGASPTYSTDERCEGNVWPERCLKKMVGLVSSHKEGFISEGDTIFERSYTYRYRNGRMNVAGHGWLGFDERTVDMYSEGAGFASTTLEYEPPARYLPNGQPAPLPFTYLYPLAGLPKRVTTIQGSHLQTDPSPLEDQLWRMQQTGSMSWKRTFHNTQKVKSL